MRLVIGRAGPTEAALARWRGRPRTDGPRTGLRDDRYHAARTIPPGRSLDDVFDAARDRLFRYRIFPPSILRPLVGTADGVARERAPVVFHALFPLMPVVLEAAVVVVETWDRTGPAGREAGIEIATLEGHPERGFERFAILLDRADRRIEIAIEAWSRPASPLVRIAGPVGRWVQVRASRAAIREFVDAVEAGGQPV